MVVPGPSPSKFNKGVGQDFWTIERMRAFDTYALFLFPFTKYYHLAYMI